MATVSVSKQNFSRLEVLLRVSDACALIGLRRRQVFGLLRSLKQDGAVSLVFGWSPDMAIDRRASSRAGVC